MQSQVLCSASLSNKLSKLKTLSQELIPSISLPGIADDIMRAHTANTHAVIVTMCRHTAHTLQQTLTDHILKLQGVRGGGSYGQDG